MPAKASYVALNAQNEDAVRGFRVSAPRGVPACRNRATGWKNHCPYPAGDPSSIKERLGVAFRWRAEQGSEQRPPFEMAAPNPWSRRAGARVARSYQDHFMFRHLKPVRN